MARASKIMAPTLYFTRQVHSLPDAPKAYGAMINRAEAAPALSRSIDLGFIPFARCQLTQISIPKLNSDPRILRTSACPMAIPTLVGWQCEI